MTNTPENAKKYDSAKLTNTHQFITVQALNMLKRDFETIAKDDKDLEKHLAILEINLEKLKEGSIAPDYGKVGVDRDYGLYQDHFFDARTEKNFTAVSGWYLASEIKDNAESQCRNYFGRAVATYLDGDYPKGIYYLGKALHYFEDSNEPHHCLNWTGGSGTAHTRFEYWAEEEKIHHKAESMRNKEDYHQFKDLDFIDFVSKMEFKHSLQAIKLEPYVSLKNTWEDWKHALDVAITDAQEGTAIMLFRFLQEVARPKNIVVKSPVGKFHVIIKTADEKYAGTDDFVYFGFEGKGKTTEYLCDLCGNDFEQGETGCYQFSFDKKNEIKPEDISKVFLRKASGGIDDQMKLENIEVYFRGKRVFKDTPNVWVKNNKRYEKSVKGLK